MVSLRAPSPWVAQTPPVLSRGVPSLGSGSQPRLQQLRRNRPRLTATSTPNKLASPTSVDELYELVSNLAPGAEPDEQSKLRIDELIEEVETVQPPQSERPLENPLIFANYQVAYTSTRKAPNQSGQPAGGRFRGRLARQLFRTTQLCQSVLEPNTVTNKVGFALLGVLKGYVGLRGSFTPVGEEADTVEVQFQPPVLSLGANVNLRIGPPSSVILTTTYLDERLRLGRGSRGSRFVFVRGGYADTADMDQIGLQQTTAAGRALLIAGIALLLACTVTLAKGTSLASKALAVFTGLLTGATATVCWKGGQQ